MSGASSGTTVLPVDGAAFLLLFFLAADEPDGGAGVCSWRAAGGRLPTIPTRRKRKAPIFLMVQMKEKLKKRETSSSNDSAFWI
jgi:hypothetical protein